ncbi:MAG: peptidase C39 [Helicobacter sp.]|nr:peptidase C39 [Helicobacter sp.]
MEKILAISMLFLLAWADFEYKSFYEIRNQGMVRQSYEESCGAASLATLINLLYEKNLDEEQILELFDNNTNMVTFLQLQEAAKKLGYSSRSYKLSREILESVSIPILIKIEDDPKFPHFVVVICYGDFFLVFDPNFGKYITKKMELYAIWDKKLEGGFGLLIAPPKNYQKPILQLLPQSIFIQK